MAALPVNKDGRHNKTEQSQYLYKETYLPTFTNILIYGKVILSGKTSVWCYM